MATDTSTWVGATLAGRYKVVAKLGGGGMGFVYRARDERLDVDVVLKLPRPALLEDAEFAGRFAREIRSLVRLEHPHIVRLTDVGEHDGLPFAVMQFLPGGSLRDLQPRRADDTALPQPAGTLHAWLPSVAAALDFIHNRQYVHRDVKPDNILFDAAGHAFLSDFGVAKAAAGSTKTTQTLALTGMGMVLGTPHFMSPEVIMGQPFDGRADQYALAVTVYQQLSGRFPFEGANAAALFVQHTTQEAVPLDQIQPDVPTAVSVAVAKAMAKEPGQRFPSCMAFARAVLEAVPVLEVMLLLPDAPVEEALPRFACPSCGKLCKVRPELLGQKARCPKCRNKINLPSALPGSRTAGIPSRTEAALVVSAKPAARTKPATQPRTPADRGQPNYDVTVVPARQPRQPAPANDPSAFDAVPALPALPPRRRKNRGVLMLLGWYVLITAVTLAVLYSLRGLITHATSSSPSTIRKAAAGVRLLADGNSNQARPHSGSSP